MKVVKRSFPRLCATFLLFSIVAPLYASSFSAGAAGGATAGALSGALNSGAGATTSTGAAGGNGATAPIEVNIMVYEGMSRLAKNIAELTGKSPGVERGPILLEDPNSSLQIGLYESLIAYYNQLKELHDDIELSFSLSASSEKIDFTGKQKFDVTVTNISPQTLKIASVNTDNEALFHTQSSGCAEGPQLPPGDSCIVSLELDRQTLMPVSKSTTIGAKLTVRVENRELHKEHVAKIVPLSVTISPAPPAVPIPAPSPDKGPLANFQLHLYSLQTNGQLLSDLATGAGTGTGGTGTGSGSGSGTASATPQWMTNFGTLGTAIEALKSGMSYSSSSLQPTTQSFQVLLANELRKAGFEAYTATSTLFVDKAATALTKMFGKMIVYSNDINNWTTECKPTTPNTKPLPECTYSNIAPGLATAQQLSTGYAALLQNANDGSGNMVLMDVLHGAALYQSFKCPAGKTQCEDAERIKIPSLQVAVVAAGGSTRVNAYFLANIFYLPTPSFNAGTIVTFELRGKDNRLVNAGVRTSFYDYNKRWQGDKFQDLDEQRTDLNCEAPDSDTFCVPGPRKKPKGSTSVP